MRIAMLGHKRIPSGSGGVELVVEELAVRLAAREHNVTCFNRSERKRITEMIYRGVRIRDVITFHARGLSAVSASFFATLRAAFGSYDVVHFHAEGPAAMCWLPKIMGKRTVVTVHGLDHQRAKWGRFAHWYILQGERCAARYADEIIVLSQNLHRYFMECYSRDTRYIPNGTSPAKFCPSVQICEGWGLEKDSYILFLGRLVPEKGLKYLLEAYRTVSTDKKLVIAGDSSDTDSFVRALKAMAADDHRIIFTGFVSGQTKAELFSNAYFYALPSDVEGMPLSLLEALSYGNCCLVSDIPECMEVVGDKAVSFPHGNVEELASRMQYLCDEPQTVARYREQSGQILSEKYSWEHIVDETLKLYAGDKTK